MIKQKSIVVICLIILFTNFVEISAQEKDCAATKADEILFDELYIANWDTVFSDVGIGDWKTNWHLDGKEGYLENSPKGMALHAGPELKNNAHHVVLWTRQSFAGDLLIEYDYTRLDSCVRRVNIIYIQATGFEEGEYSKDIFEWNQLREVPAMKTYYNNMHIFHISYAAFDDDGEYIRARRYRPDRHNRKKNTELGATFNTGFFDTGVKHHITIIKKGFDVYMKVANSEKSELYKWNYSEHPEIFEGRIGLRQMQKRSSLYKNFVVKKIGVDSQ